MILRIILGLFLFLAGSSHGSESEDVTSGPLVTHFFQISDDNWEEIQEGKWLVGIFHQESPQSVTLEKDWNVFALKCKELDIKVGMIKAHENPELQVRFLAKEFPKVFHIDDGTVRVFPTPTRDELVRIIKDKRWDELEHVSKFSDPFSTHLSLFSYLCSRALLLYNFEKQLISNYTSSPSAVNSIFGLTFILFGTALGLVFSCLFQFLKFAFDCCLKREHLESSIEKVEPEESVKAKGKASKGNSKKYHLMKGRTKVRKRKP